MYVLVLVGFGCHWPCPGGVFALGQTDLCGPPPSLHSPHCYQFQLSVVVALWDCW